ncbi:hypothetical protein NLI96_g147 [Meripilus lineatus]|uniref:DUF6535 domain-containing protein n=1 Tax=Meripilus lineatus TaxID=2056292 RepID=A0AAD5VFC0_9APHY|nr:hypothetical protein NLI96_g147 [Physisporinus lineatus]
MSSSEFHSSIHANQTFTFTISLTSEGPPPSINLLQSIPGPRSSSESSETRQDVWMRVVEQANEAIRGGKTLAQLKKVFDRRCAFLEHQFPDLAWKRTGGWNALAEILKNHDAREVKYHNDNIDTLLILAGLYSAILTAFIIEAYRRLRRDPAEASMEILVEIAEELRSFMVNSGFINSTHTITSLPTGIFVPEPSSISVIGLWLTALFLSLVAASLGMLVKQWLREFLKNIHDNPQEHSRVRLFRMRGLRKYKGYQFASLLPLLLQISLLFFFAGLIVFARRDNETIGFIITILASLWFFFFFTVTIFPFLPGVSPSCPYKTPILRALVELFKHLVERLYKIVRSFVVESRGSDRAVPLFGGDKELDVSLDSEQDVDVLLDAYNTSRDISVWETVMRCIDLHHPTQALDLLFLIIAKKRDPSRSTSSTSKLGSGEWNAWDDLLLEERRFFLGSMIRCIWQIFIMAHEGVEHRLERRHLPMLFNLHRFSSGLEQETSSRADDVILFQMANMLIQEALTIPFSPEPLVEYVLWMVDQSINPSEIWEGANNHAFIEGLYKVWAHDTMPESVMLKRICMHLTRHLAQKVGSSSLSTSVATGAPNAPGVPDGPLAQNVLKWNLLLDMAMSVEKRSKGVIHTDLFEALYERSLKLLDLLMEKHATLTIQDFTNNIPDGRSTLWHESREPFDWDRACSTHCRYGAPAQSPTDGGAEDSKWDFQTLSTDPASRIDFLLNFWQIPHDTYKSFLL